MKNLLSCFIFSMTIVSCTVGEGNPLGEPNQRDPSCGSKATACLEKTNWLIEFDSLLPHNLRLEINGLTVLDECRNGDQGPAIVDRRNKRVEILNFYKPSRNNEFKMTNLQKNCMGTQSWMWRLSPNPPVPYRGEDYTYFKLDY